MCLPQVVKSFQNYRGVATTFYPTLVYVGRASRPTILSLEPSQALRFGTSLAIQSLVPSSKHTTKVPPFVQKISMSLRVNPYLQILSTTPPTDCRIYMKFSRDLDLRMVIEYNGHPNTLTSGTGIPWWPNFLESLCLPALGCVPGRPLVITTGISYSYCSQVPALQ